MGSPIPSGVDWFGDLLWAITGYFWPLALASFKSELLRGPHLRVSLGFLRVSHTFLLYAVGKHLKVREVGLDIPTLFL